MSNCYLHSKLPKTVNLEIVRCVKMTMDDGTEYTVKIDDLVGIQFIKNDNQILVRKGRVKDLVVINSRELSTRSDNVSKIILDCSEQFSVKIVEIKFSDVIKIGKIDDEFNDYNDRITELDPSHLEESSDVAEIPVKDQYLHNEDECTIHNTTVTTRGFAVTR